MNMKRILAAAALLCAFATLAGAQTQPIEQPHATFVDAVGNPCAGCSLYSYAAGTTTPLATYSDAAGAVPHTNPIILGTDGGANIWLGSNAYKFALKDADGTLIWTVDQVSGWLNYVGGKYLPLTGGTMTGQLNAYEINSVFYAKVGDSLQTWMAGALASGGTLVVPEGTFSGALTVPANVSLICASRRSIITIANATNAAVITVAGSNIAIKHCTIDGDASGQASNGWGIVNSSDYSNLDIEDNEIRNTQRVGIRSNGGTGSISHVTIKGNYIHDTNEQSLYLLGMDDISITDNVFANWTLGGAGNAPAITLADGNASSATYHITNLVIADNTFKNSIGTRFSIESAAPAYSTVVNGCAITGNVFNGNNLDASGVSGYFFKCSMTGNTHVNGGGGHRSGYEVVGNNLTIGNNSIDNGSIALTSTTNSSVHDVITGNTITNSSANGVNDASCILVGGGDVATTDASITGNICSLTNANPQSGIYLGVYGTSQTINRILVSNNKIQCNGAGNAVRLFAGAGSTDVTVSKNTGSNCGAGYIDSSDANHTTDITLSDNDFSGNTTPISLVDTTTIRQWGNITSTTQTGQQFAGGAGASGAGAGFFPSGVANGDTSTPPQANLTGWYAASTACSVDGASLASWAPAQSSAGGTLAGGTTKAICKLSIVNGQAVVRFSGTANGYQGLLAAGTGPSTMFVVYSKTIAAPGAGNAVLVDNSQFPLYGGLYFPDPVTMAVHASGAALTVAVADDGLFHAAAWTITAGNTATVYLAGSSILTGSVGASPFFPGITIGARQDQTDLFTGDIAEVLVYNGVMNSTQLAAVGAYLLSKYGVAYSGTWSVDSSGTAAINGLKVAGGTTMTGNQGNGVKAQHSTGTLTSGNILKSDANGNAIDGGAAAASVVTAGAPTVGQAACVKSLGPPIVFGYCSTTVGAGGACTCN